MSDTSLGTATAQIRIDGSQAASGAAQMQTAMNSLNKVVSSNWWGLQAIGNVLAGLGAAGVAAFGEAADAASEWDAQMAQLDASLNGAAGGTATSAAEIAGLSSSIIELGQTTAVPLSDLANIANELAKVGVSGADIPGVTATIAQLGSVTGESTEDMIESFGRFSATLGLTGNSIKQAGSAIFDLSRQTPATAENIAIVTDRIDGLHESAGVTTPDLLGIASAVATIAPNARTAASTINQTFAAIGTAVDSGGVKLQDFADLAGMTQAQFVAAWQKGDTTDIFTKIIQGLGQYSDATGNLDAVLKNLGLSSSSNSQILGGLASAQGQYADSTAKLSTQLDIANKSYKDGNDLQNTAKTLYQQFASQLIILENAAHAVAITFGNEFLPLLKPAVGLLDDLATGFENMTGGEKGAIEITGAVLTVIALATGTFFKLVPMLIQARSGFQNLAAGLAQYGAAQATSVSAGSALLASLAAQVEATEEVTTSVLDEDIAQAKLQATLAAAAVKQDAATASARAAVSAQAELTAAEDANTAAVEAASAANAAYAAQLEEINAMSRGEIVAAGSAAGIPKSSSTSTAALTEGLTADNAAAASAANDTLTASEVRLEAAQIAQSTAAQKSVLADAQSEVSRLQAAKAAGIETDAVVTNTKAIIDETDAKLASNRTPLENDVINSTTTETTTTGAGAETVGPPTGQEAALAANSELTTSYTELAALMNTYDAAVASQTAAEERAAEAIQVRAAAMGELQAVMASSTASEEELVAANNAVASAFEEVSLTAAAAAAAVAETAAAESAAAAAADVLAASSDAAALGEDAASLGLATVAQVAGVATLAATLGVTAWTAHSGALERDAQAAKDAAGPNQELVDILTQQGAAVQQQVDQWIGDQLVTHNLTGEMTKLGITAADVISIISGSASSPALLNFTAEADNGTKAGKNLLAVVTQLTETYNKSSQAAAVLNGKTTANAAADSALTGADTDLNNSLGATAETASQLAAALDKSYSALEDLVGAENDVSKAAESVTSAQESLTAALAKQADQAEDVQKATIDLAKAQLTLQDETQTLADDQTALGQAAAAQAQETADANKGLIDAQNKLTDADNAVTDAQTKLNTAMDPTISLNAYNDAVAKLADANNSLVDSQATVASAQWNLNYLMEEGASNADIAAAQRELSDAQQKQTDDTNAVADATQDLKTTQSDQASAVVDAQASLNDAIQSQADALSNVATAQTAVTQAQTDAANNKDYTAALEKVQSDQLDLQSDTLAVKDAQVALSTAQNEGASLANAVATAQSGLADAYLAQANAIVKVQQDQVELSGGVWTSQMATEALLGALQQIVPGAGAAQGAVQNMINTIVSNLPNVRAAADAASGTGGGGGGGGIAGIGPAGVTAGTNANNGLKILTTGIKGEHIPTLQSMEAEYQKLSDQLSNTSPILLAGRAGDVVNTAYTNLQAELKTLRGEQDTYRGNLTLLQGAFGTTEGAIEKAATAGNIDLSQALTRPEVGILQNNLDALGGHVDEAATHFSGMNTTVSDALIAIDSSFTAAGKTVPSTAQALAILTTQQFTGSFGLTGTVGTNAMSGILQKMIDEANKDSPKTAKAVADKVVQDLEQSFLIGSPSKRTGDEVGVFVSQGILVGMQQGQPALTQGAANLANTTVASAVAAMNAGLKSSTINVSSLLPGNTNVMSALTSGSTVPVDPSVTATNNAITALTAQLATLTAALGENTSGLSDVAAGSQLGASGTATATTGDTYNFHEVQVSSDQIIREAAWRKRINPRR